MAGDGASCLVVQSLVHDIPVPVPGFGMVGLGKVGDSMIMTVI
nr:hypothetical protein [Tanacetum cinerariifolium]